MFKQTTISRCMGRWRSRTAAFRRAPDVKSGTLRLLMRTLNAKNTKRKSTTRRTSARLGRLFDALGGPDRVTWATFFLLEGVSR